MDKKAEQILEYYKGIIKNRVFLEYDILGFLIFIREYIKNDNEKYKYIIEFADLIAHRTRDRGIVMECIKGAINNQYSHEQDSKKLTGYDGVNVEEWEYEWSELAKEYTFDINPIIIKEITLCIYSLAQNTLYLKNEYKGIVNLSFFHNDNSIALLTTEGEKDSLFVCFAKYSGFDINEEYNGTILNDIGYTIREENRLKFIINNKIAVEIKYE